MTLNCTGCLIVEVYPGSIERKGGEFLSFYVNEAMKNDSNVTSYEVLTYNSLPPSQPAGLRTEGKATIIDVTKIAKKFAYSPISSA